MDGAHSGIERARPGSAESASDGCNYNCICMCARHLESRMYPVC